MTNLVFDLPIEIQDKIFRYYYKNKYDEVIKEYLYSSQRLHAIHKELRWHKLNYLNTLKRQLLVMRGLVENESNLF